MNSLIISVFRYGCPLLINSNVNMINKLQSQLKKCTHYILGHKSYKMSSIAIMKELKMLTIQHMIIKESIGFIHKVIFNENPTCIFNLLTFNEAENVNIRKVRKMRVKGNLNSEKVRQSLIYRSLFLFNTLEYDVRCYSPKKFSKYLGENIAYIFIHNHIPKQNSE